MEQTFSSIENLTERAQTHPFEVINDFATDFHFLYSNLTDKQCSKFASSLMHGMLDFIDATHLDLSIPQAIVVYLRYSLQIDRYKANNRGDGNEFNSNYNEVLKIAHEVFERRDIAWGSKNQHSLGPFFNGSEIPISASYLSCMDAGNIVYDGMSVLQEELHRKKLGCNSLRRLVDNTPFGVLDDKHHFFRNRSCMLYMCKYALRAKDVPVKHERSWEKAVRLLDSLLIRA